MDKVFYILPIFLFFMIRCGTPETADLLMINGRIHTVDSLNSVVQAVGVSDGRIIFSGGNEQALKLKGEDTRLIDLEGKLMTPGLIEGHGHFMGMGYNLLNLDLAGTQSFEEIVALVKTRADSLAPGEWIIGRGWHQEKWDHLPAGMYQGFPSHEMLSKASPDNPVCLRHASGHAMLVNKKAMEIAGIDWNTEQVDGGEIIRNSGGNPTGIFTENAMGLMSMFLPGNDHNSDTQAYRLATNNCIREGITSFHDAGTGQQTIDLYREMIENGQAQVRLYVMLDGSDSGLIDHYFSIGPQIDTVEKMLTVRSVKLYMDGALGSRGAWLLEPYADQPGHYGHAVTTPEFIKGIAERAIRSGFQVCTHAIGDRANRETLDIYESVFTDNPEVKQSRFRIEHAQHLNPSDIPRFVSLGVLPAMQAIHMSSDRPWAIDRLGEKRIKEGAYVWQDLLRTGAKVINGTDVPVEPISPVACFYASVTRKTLQGLPEGGYETDLRMTREQALQTYTINAAYGAFEEKIKGSIEIGKLADFAVFSQDLMTIPEDKILETKVVMTIIGGDVVYQSGD